MNCNNQKNKNENKNENKDNFNASLSESSRSITVLMVDDEEIWLMTGELLLKDSGYKLIKANGGIAALEYLSDNMDTIDIILLDLMMPDIDGLNVLHEIKKNERLAKIPVILQSSISEGSEIEKAYEMGIVSNIKKPYTKNVMINEIKKYCKTWYNY